ncbi:LysR family transcriptional regulator [Oceanisphaera psychrotolerans]|uniref:HTH lysR-type domain-containing protein n=1 Tax=Oceanisphaera psychrotolerans TaxID=1414654 RepID=A0A1J4QIC3_9GAMM|nr:LysR family transcriptional regulator [Oceanisphaera psychrotolerans]OIN12229.1 hypothetical protein BFR47_00575 [Oceanisphaera psychrotolerans]
MSRDIDISLIRAFLAVAETGGMTSAAHALNLTQGAVSQKIRRLESLFAAQLFERNHKVIRLTPEGERLLARAHRLVSLNDETWQMMRKPDFAGEIRLGVPADIIRPMMPPIMRRFSREHPKIRLTLVCDMTETLLAALRNGEIDLTLTTESQAGRGDALLLRDQLVWMGAQNGEACHKTPLPVSLGSEVCAFRAATLDALSKAEIDWLTTCDVGNLESILATIEADLAVSPYLSTLVPENLNTIPADIGLPALPPYYINLRMPDSGGTLIANELARYIRQGFAALHAPGAARG